MRQKNNEKRKSEISSLDYNKKASANYHSTIIVRFGTILYDTRDHLPTSTYKCEAFLDATKSTTTSPICCSPSSVKTNATGVPLAVVTLTSITTGSVQLRTVKETFQPMLLFTQTNPVQSVFGVQDGWKLVAAAADKLWHSSCAREEQIRAAMRREETRRSQRVEAHSLVSSPREQRSSRSIS